MTFLKYASTVTKSDGSFRDQYAFLNRDLRGLTDAEINRAVVDYEQRQAEDRQAEERFNRQYPHLVDKSIEYRRSYFADKRAKEVAEQAVREALWAQQAEAEKQAEREQVARWNQEKACREAEAQKAEAAKAALRDTLDQLWAKTPLLPWKEALQLLGAPETLTTQTALSVLRMLEHELTTNLNQRKRVMGFWLHLESVVLNPNESFDPAVVLAFRRFRRALRQRSSWDCSDQTSGVAWRYWTSVATAGRRVFEKKFPLWVPHLFVETADHPTVWRATNCLS